MSTFVKDLDDAAWARLLAETVDRVVRRLSASRIAPDEAEETGAEVAHRLLRYRHAKMTSDAIGALAWTIARNLEVDRFRARQREAHHLRRQDMRTVSAAEREDIVLGEEENHLRTVLLKVLSTLPLHNRELLWMRFVDGATYRQIAQTQAMSPSTTRRRVNEAVQQFEAALRTHRANDPDLGDILLRLGIKL